MRLHINVRIGTLPSWETSRSNRAAVGGTPILPHSITPMLRSPEFEDENEVPT
jgi:hypothetical protein